MTICVLDRFLADRFELDKGPLELDCRRHRQFRIKKRNAASYWRVALGGTRGRSASNYTTRKNIPSIAPEIARRLGNHGQIGDRSECIRSHHAMQLVEALREQEHR